MSRSGGSFLSLVLVLSAGSCNAVPPEPNPVAQSASVVAVASSSEPRRLWIAPEDGSSDVPPGVVIMIGIRGKAAPSELTALADSVKLKNLETGMSVSVKNEARGADSAESLVDVKALVPLTAGRYRLDVGHASDLAVPGSSRATSDGVASEFVVGSAPRLRVLSLCGAKATLEFSEPVDIASDGDLDFGSAHCVPASSPVPPLEKGSGSARRRYTWACDRPIVGDIAPLIPGLRSGKGVAVASRRLPMLSMSKLHREFGCAHAFVP